MCTSGGAGNVIPGGYFAQQANRRASMDSAPSAGARSTFGGARLAPDIGGGSSSITNAGNVIGTPGAGMGGGFNFGALTQPSSGQHPSDFSIGSFLRRQTVAA